MVNAFGGWKCNSITTPFNEKIGEDHSSRVLNRGASTEEVLITVC